MTVTAPRVSTWRQFNSSGTITKLLLCRPDYYQDLPISETANTSIDAGDKVDVALARRMYDEFVAALEGTDIELHWESPDPAHYWQVFTRDFGANTPAGPLVGRFKYAQRFGDEAFAIAAFDAIGVTVAAQITAGAVEGGDCWMLDEATLVIGSGNRSTLRGIANATELMAPLGIEVVPVEFLAKWNHLDMIFSVIGERTALYSPDGLPENYAELLIRKGWRLIPVPLAEVLKTGCNVLCLGGDRILSFAENGIVNDMLRGEGLTVLAPPLREFTKMGGGPHCLTFELERSPT